MNLEEIFQPLVAKAHLLSLAVLIVFAAAFRRRWWAHALSLVALTSSAIMVAILAIILIGSLTVGGGGGPGGFMPNLFADGYGGGFICYLFVFIIGFAFRPRPFRLGPLALCIALPLFYGLSSALLMLPRFFGRTVTIHVCTADAKPLPGVSLKYKTKWEKGAFSAQSDAEGRITLPMKLGDTIHGEFPASATHAYAKIYVPEYEYGNGNRQIFVHWSVPFATNRCAFQSNMFSEFDESNSVEIYLSPPDSAALLPYRKLANFAGRLDEAQRTGKMFNPEMSIQNLESYIQLSAVAAIYDPRSPVGNHAESVFTRLAAIHDDLESILKILCSGKFDSTIRDRGLDQMLAILQIPPGDATSWEQKRDLVQARLDSDLAVIKNVPRP